MDDLTRPTWIEDGSLLACAYPRDGEALAELADEGISVLVNLHERSHDPEALAIHGLTEVHIPVADFTPPAPHQLDAGVAAIEGAEGAVAVHCAAGLGRTGTLLACYLVSKGSTPDEAIDRVRAARPGSVETAAQVEAVREYARKRAARDQ